MKKFFTILSTAALVVMGALTTSCDKEYNAIKHNPDGSVTFRTTLHMAASTKSIIEADGEHKFKVGDEIAIVYDNGTTHDIEIVVYELKASDIKEGQKTAEFEVTLNNPKYDQGLFFAYPASKIKNDSSGLDYDALATQNGTLDNIATMDLCVGVSSWDGSAWGSATLENLIAIGKFTIKNSSNEDITSSITEMTVSDGTNTYTISRSPADGPIWVAMQPVDDKSITVTATDGSYWYNKTTESAQTLAASKIYPINVTMTKFAATLSASAVGEIVGSDGRAYNVADINNLPTGVTALAMVAYKNGSNGLAISLTDIDTYKLNYAQATGEYGIPAWSASYPIVGGSWRIPTEQDWQRMMWGYYVENPAATNISAFQALLGTTYGLVANGYYWTGSEVDTDNARAILYDGTYAGIDNADKDEYFHVRACLAF